MKQRVLILYFSFTNQTHRVAMAMRDEFLTQGCSVELAPIEMSDPRFQIRMPFRPIVPKLLSWAIPQLFRWKGDVRFDESILSAEFDLVCIGSPTWFFHPAMPITSFLKTSYAKTILHGKPFVVFAVCRKLWWNNLRMVKKLATANGGKFLDGAAFWFQGNEIRRRYGD